MSFEDDDIIKEFVSECIEHLDCLDNDLVAIEQDTSNNKILAAIFRSMHTIKGGAGMLAFNNLEKLTHAAESLLSLLRDGKLHMNEQCATTLLQTVDAVRGMLRHIAQTGRDGDDEHTALIDMLHQLKNQESKPPEKAKTTKAKAAETEAASPEETREETPVASSEETVAVPFQEETVAASILEETVAVPIQEETVIALVQEDLVTGLLQDERPVLKEITAAQTENALPLAEAEQGADTSKTPALADNTLRINVDLLDKLMNLVGELVLSRNQILQYNTIQSDSNFLAVSQRLNLITSELQEGVMKTRMQPIGNIWNKFPRVIRLLATTCNKKVRLEMHGKETELDKTLIEAINDPLTHLVRNSVDHGIETPEQRLALGKPEEGVLSLKAYHEGGFVNVEITDDGGGIATDRIVHKALTQGLITPDQVPRMSEKDIYNLIFLPGFSTKDNVTSVSGRGVGMDVVRTNIEKINGGIEIQSKVDCFTTIKIKIPLTLAIIPALLVSCGENRYAIPQISLLELIRLDSKQKEQIQYIKETPVYELRGKLLPLIYLTNELNLPTDKATTSLDDSINIVILQAGETKFGLVVDDVSDTQEIVVKPLSKLFRNIAAFAGATILGDGKISLILDVNGLASRAKLLSNHSHASAAVIHNQGNLQDSEKHTLLLLKAGMDNLIAVPLNKVNRIEEFPVNHIEKAGGQEVIQYRHTIMPLIRLSSIIHFDHDAPEKKDTVQVIVYSNLQHNIGLIVDQVDDIVEGNFAIDKHMNRNGILGTTVVEDKVTELIDIENIIHTALPEFTNRMTANTV